MFLFFGTENSLLFAQNSNGDKIVKTKVEKIIDLKTIQVEQGKIIKLYGISDYFYQEFNDHFKRSYEVITQDGTPFGLGAGSFKGESVEELRSRAITFYKDLLVGRYIILEKVPLKEEYIVYLDQMKKNSINQLAVKQGFVVASNNKEQILNLIITQEEAKMSKAGLWDITIFVKDTTPPVNSNFYELGVLLVCIFALISICSFLYYLRNKSLWSMLFYYFIFFVVPIVSLGIYTDNEKHIYYWLPSVFVGLSIIFCIYDFIYMIYSRKNLSIFRVSLAIFLYVTFVIFSFGTFYMGQSNNLRTESEISYSLPDFKLNYKEEIKRPMGDYIFIPENEYQVLSIIEGKTGTPQYYLTPLNAIYFSATTFFTVGYGDFLPKGDLKILSIVEMIIGYISQAVFFTMIVSKAYDIASQNPEKKLTKKKSMMKRATFTAPQKRGIVQ